MSKSLLLISSSATHGTGYLDHAADEIQGFMAGAERILFVPFALHNHDAYASRVRQRLGSLGFEVDSLHAAADPREAVSVAQGIFVGGGNTFRLLNRLYELDLIDEIRARVESGIPYMGTSAGTNLACVTIKTTNDMPIVMPPSLDALRLVPFNINPHFVEPAPGSVHMGETRETRIREFHEMNDPVVVGLREGAMLRIRGPHMMLLGEAGARLFEKGKTPTDVAPGADLDHLLLASR